MNWYSRIMLLMAGFAALTLTSCSDDDPETTQPEPPKPEKLAIAGSYAPFIVDPVENPVGALRIDAKWLDPANVPTVDLTSMGMGPLPLNLVLEIVNQLAGGYYAGGLAQFDFHEDGSVGAKYHKVTGASIMEPEFSKESFIFPGTDPNEIAAAKAISCSTKGDLLFISVKKAFIIEMGKKEGIDLCAAIDGILAKYPNLSITSTAEAYAIPMKYTVGTDKSLTIYIDKAMMMPYLPLLTEVVLPLIPEQADFAGTTIPARAMLTKMLSDLFTQTESLVISIKLQKIA